MLDGLHEANTTAAFEHHYSQQVVAKGKKIQTVNNTH